MPLTTGTRLGPYEILAPLGAGGMGEVYRALDPRLEREVAVKVLARGLEHDEEALARFEREAKAVAALSHPNILSIHDFAVEGGLPFAVTELLEGQSLRERLEQGPVAWRDAAQIGVAIAEGLAAAHAKGIVHRDIKPDNLFLTADDRVKILDFGLARSDRAWPTYQSDSSTPTVMAGSDSGSVMGTLGYMSPEQARGLDVGATSDIFSLGCVLYEMMTGRRPFARATATDTLAAILNDPPQPISQSGRHVPPELARIVDHCLEKNPSARFQTANDLGFALRAVLDDSGIGAAPTARRRTASSRVRSLAALPFATEAADADAEYLSDGITEGLVNRLSQLPKLRVVPRSTAFRYKGRDLDPRTAGIELNVDALLTGRIVVRGEAVTVQAELVDTRTLSQIWGQRYMREHCQCFELEDRIADEIAGALKIRLGATKAATKSPSRAATQGPAPRSAAPNAEAYRDYLRGRYFYNKWTAEGFAKAIEYFQKAIEHDPAYAAAYAGLGDTYGAAGFYGFVPQAEAMPRASFAAARALELDPNLAEAHATKGLCLLFHEWKWGAAHDEFARAIELDPRFAAGHLYQSLYFASQGRVDEALDTARRAEHLDPLSPLVISGTVWALMFTRRFDDAQSQAYRALELNPESPDALSMLGALHEMQGRFLQAIPRRRQWLQALGAPPDAGDLLVKGLEEGGPQGYWRAFAEVIEQLGSACAGLNYARATVQVKLGNVDAVFRWLNQSFDEHAASLVFLKAEPIFSELRNDPRFSDLLRRMELPE